LTPQIFKIHTLIAGGMHLATLDAHLLNLRFLNTFKACDQSLVVVVVKDVIIIFILTNILIKEPVPVYQEQSSMIIQDFIPLLAY
jgi:hypothetical protein